MYEFVDRFFNVALPRVRDFRGINGNGFDGRGNFACGIKEQIIFPEIDFDKSMQSVAWMSALLPPLRPTKRARSC